MSRCLYLTLTAALVLALGSTAMADIPKTISFQGRLADDSGAPINGNVNLTLVIYSAGGASLFGETHTGLAVTDGVFNVLIGSQTVGGVPSSVFASADRSVGLSVNSDAEMTPRLPLSAVPYAYVAESAQTFEVPQSISASNNAALLHISNTGSGDAVVGTGSAGKGVYGHSNGDYGVYAGSTSGPGAIYGQAGGAGARGVRGVATGTGSTVGVMGEAMGSTEGIGMVGNGGNRGMQGYGQYGHGVYGTTAATSGTNFGGYFVGNSHFGGGVYGSSIQGTGVKGEHTHATLTSPGVFGNNTGWGAGVLGWATNAASAAVHGQHQGAGPGGKFSSDSGPAIVAEGEVQAEKITYTTAREHYLSLGSMDFAPGSNEDFVNSYANYGANIAHTGAGAIAAAVHLPHGATVTVFKVYYRDIAPGNMSIELQRTGWSPMAEITTSGTPGTTSGTDTSITDPVVDNLNHAYAVRVYSTNWPGPLNQDLRIIRAVITYTITEAE
ncbi:MAG: hypothetical protein HQ592_08255 [Planctomycetes bacterium]|nr:hypothetical protein [Planctomycetota bacterium]